MVATPCGFDSRHRHHVGASFVSLAPIFFKNQSALTPLFYFSGPFESKFCSNNSNDLIDNCCGTIHMHAENNNDNNKRQAQQGTVCSHSFCQNIFRHGICSGRTEYHTEQQIVHAKGMIYTYRSASRSAICGCCSAAGAHFMNVIKKAAACSRFLPLYDGHAVRLW